MQLKIPQHPEVETSVPIFTFILACAKLREKRGALSI